MLHNFADPVIRYSVAPVLGRGQLISRGVGKTTIHFNGSTENIVAPLGHLRPVASGQLDKQEILTQPPFAEMQANEERR